MSPKYTWVHPCVRLNGVLYTIELVNRFLAWNAVEDQSSASRIIAKTKGGILGNFVSRALNVFDDIRQRFFRNLTFNSLTVVAASCFRVVRALSLLSLLSYYHDSDRRLSPHKT